MIWILTPHWKTDKWIPLQHERIKLLEGDASRFGVLATVPWQGEKWNRFFMGHWFHEPKFPLGPKKKDFPNHWIKLDFLFRKALELGAQDDHIIIFLDGDAFPIGSYTKADFRPRLHAILDKRKYVFIKEPAEHKPHCGFFACKVEDWRGMSWCPGQFDMLGPDGYPVKSEFDIGGPLHPLVDDGISKLLVQTSAPRHPEFFATWGDENGPLVYHHGAGFRLNMVSRAERARDVNGREANVKNREVSEEVFEQLKRGDNLW